MLKLHTAINLISIMIIALHTAQFGYHRFVVIVSAEKPRVAMAEQIIIENQSEWASKVYLSLLMCNDLYVSLTRHFFFFL